LLIWLLAGLTIGASFVVWRGKSHEVYHQITNKSYPVEVERHFGSAPFTTIPASSVGMRDGTCYVYSNQTSWAVFECFGATDRT